MTSLIDAAATRVRAGARRRYRPSGVNTPPPPSPTPATANVAVVEEDSTNFGELFFLYHHLEADVSRDVIN